MAAAIQSTASDSTSSRTTTTVNSATTNSTNMEDQPNPERRSSSLRGSSKRSSKKSSTASTSGSAGKTSRHKVKKSRSHSERSSNPKESLSKDKRPNPQVPPQLGNINPLATDDKQDSQQLEESLRWNSLNSSVSTAPTNDSTTGYNSFAQQSQQSFLVLPSTPNSNLTTGSKATLLVAHPDEVTAQLLQAIQDDKSTSNFARSDLANLIQQAMGRVVQNATDNGALLTPALAQPQVQFASPSLQETVTEMRQELKEQKQLFLDFQKQMLMQQEQQQTQIQQQAKLLEQQQTLLEAQQKQLLDLKNDVLMQSQQSARSQPRSVASSPAETRSALDLSNSSRRSPPKSKRQQQQRKSMDETDMRNSLGAFPQFEQSDSQSQQFEESFALDTVAAAAAAAQPPMNHSDSFVQSYSSSFANSKSTTISNIHNNVILNRDDSNATIETDYEDDSDYQADSDEEDIKQESPPSSPKDKPLSEATNATVEKMVEVWICPSCKFEHEFSRLQFCGVCGAPRPDPEKEEEADTPNQTTAITSAKECQSPLGLVRSSSSRSYTQCNSPIPPQEPLIQLQLHKELQGSSHGSENLDLPPKSPHRKKVQYRRSNSTTNIPPKQRSRQPRLQRSKSQESEQLRATYHGANRKDSFVVKCVDGGDTGAVFDIDVLNQQLSTFETSQEQGPAGSAPTASAPKTPKVNKRKTIRRSKSTLDRPDDEQPLAAPAVFGGSTAKPNATVRQAIPRRAKSSSTEQLRMHQLQQQGGAMKVPPSPATNKPRTSIFGSAVSALHKSPKKAITALKIAGNSMPKSLMLGGGGGSSGNEKKGKNHAFLLDSDDENGEEATAAATSASTTRGRSDSVDASDQASTEPPPTPKSRASLEARARASVTSGQKSGWKKWFDSGSKNTAAAAAAEEEEPVLDLDIDDSVHDVGDEEEGANDSEEEPEAAPTANRNRRHRRSTGRTSASGNLRSSTSRRRDHMETQLRSSAHTGGGSNRNLQSSNLGGSSTEANMRGSRLDVLATPRRNKPRLRRTKSLESTGSDQHGSGRRLTSSQTSDSSGQLLIVPSGSSSNNNKHGRDGNNRRRRSAVEGRPSSRRLSSSELSTDGPSAENTSTKKSDHMKHRVQGLRKTSTEKINSDSSNNANHGSANTNTQSKAASSGTTEESESDDGCSIYLDMSIGAMSEITHIF